MPKVIAGKWVKAAKAVRKVMRSGHYGTTGDIYLCWAANQALAHDKITSTERALLSGFWYALNFRDIRGSACDLAANKRMCSALRMNGGLGNIRELDRYKVGKAFWTGVVAYVKDNPQARITAIRKAGFEAVKALKL